MLMKSKNRRNPGYKCAVSKVQVEWLAVNAFRDVLGKRQSRYGKVLEWIDGRIAMLGTKDAVCYRMKGLVGLGSSD